jgi:hypothetical protein
MNVYGKNRRPVSPIRTAVPLKKMLLPAVSTVRGTASETGPCSSSSRKRLTAKRA